MPVIHPIGHAKQLLLANRHIHEPILAKSIVRITLKTHPLAVAIVPEHGSPELLRFVCTTSVPGLPVKDHDRTSRQSWLHLVRQGQSSWWFGQVALVTTRD